MFSQTLKPLLFSDCFYWLKITLRSKKWENPHLGALQEVFIAPCAKFQPNPSMFVACILSGVTQPYFLFFSGLWENQCTNLAQILVRVLF
jgi:hypothetical protein